MNDEIEDGRTPINPIKAVLLFLLFCLAPFWTLLGLLFGLHHVSQQPETLEELRRRGLL
jgi:hypothetical protein